MKARTGEPSRKERMKQKVHGLFELAPDRSALLQFLRSEGLTLYERGQSVGIIEQTPDGKERRYRLASLGLDLHYEATQKRFTRAREEQAMEHKQPTVSPNWTEGTPSAIEIVESELLTGELHEHWHGTQDEKTYTDDILHRAQERTQDIPTKKKEEDRER